MKVRWILVLLLASQAVAKVDLVTLPGRDQVQLTIYKSADLTLVRETRLLTLKEGHNALQFSWENTLIDPTSLEMLPKAHAGAIDIAALVYPPRVRNLGLWNIDSGRAGEVPVEITYLTSGLTWRAFYMGTLTPDEKTLQLQAYVRVTNNSGEDYENAQTRLIVGKVHILDEIAALARRQWPYGSPAETGVPESAVMLGDRPVVRAMLRESVMELDALVSHEEPKQIVKEGLSEYFLYTIEGTETIPTGWSKRLPSFDVDGIAVESLYKYDEHRWGPSAVRYVSFANDDEHELGETPIPDGTVRIYRENADGHLSYIGGTTIKYIPVDEDIELNLGPDSQVKVEPVLMETRTDNYRFDTEGNISGWDDVQSWKVTVTNTRELPVRMEIFRHFGTPYWTIQNRGDFGDYAPDDAMTGKYVLQVEPRSKREFEYVLTMYQGTRQEEYRRR